MHYHTLPPSVTESVGPPWFSTSVALWTSSGFVSCSRVIRRYICLSVSGG